MIEPKEKLARFLAAYDLSYADADRLSGQKIGFTSNNFIGKSSKLWRRDDAKARSYYQAITSGKPVTPDWFFDGVDDQPAPIGTEAEVIPVVALIPSNAIPGESPISDKRPAYAPNAVYVRAIENMGPISDGDLLLVDPNRQIKGGAIVALQVSSVYRTLHIAVRDGEGFRFEPLCPNCPPAPAEFSVMGVVIRLRRLWGQTTVTFDAEHGLTPQMIPPLSR